MFEQIKKVIALRKEYPKGTRVKLISMTDDPNPIEAETCGTVDEVDDIGTIHVNWDNGRTLGLCPDIDKFEKIS